MAGASLPLNEHFLPVVGVPNHYKRVGENKAQLSGVGRWLQPQKWTISPLMRIQDVGLGLETSPEPALGRYWS